MVCSQCRASAPDDKKFCGECGAALAVPEAVAVPGEDGAFLLLPAHESRDAPAVRAMRSAHLPEMHGLYACRDALPALREEQNRAASGGGAARRSRRNLQCRARRGPPGLVSGAVVFDFVVPAWAV